MSTMSDLLAEQVRQSVSEGKATQEDWDRALDEVFAGVRPTGTPLQGETLPLDPLEPSLIGTDEYAVSWRINQDATSPAEAAARVWRSVFRRGPFQPSADEACVMTVVNGDRAVEIDLSEERFAHLFELGEG